MGTARSLSGTVLVVDDNATNLKLARVVLEGAGFEVLTAESATEATQVLEHFTVAVVLMDIHLPDIDGLELTRHLKSRWQGLRVIALTAKAMEGDREKALVAGCDEYVSKPIDTERLPAIVARFV